VTGSPDTVEAEVVSISSGEPSDLAKVAQPSRVRGSVALAWVEHDPFQWGGPHLTWSDRNEPEAPPVFVLDDIEELESWSRIQTGCQTLNQALTTTFNVLHNDIYPAG
jgi:hypothetical protein